LRGRNEAEENARIRLSRTHDSERDRQRRMACPP